MLNREKGSSSIHLVAPSGQSLVREVSPGVPSLAAASRAPLGATKISADEWRFVVWAPHAHQVAVQMPGRRPRSEPLERDTFGYHSGVLSGVEPDARYFFRLEDRKELPDPASRFQPEGVHGPSQVIDYSNFAWQDSSWKAPDLENSLLYELHVGTFTPAGTFDSVIPQLDSLKRLGVTTIELMPVAQFPGARNWGYDGTFPYAAQNSYGGPRGLLRLVNAAHSRGLAVALDVVYNHLGPEGNYLREFGPYLTDRYRSPWGDSINFDGAGSDAVRRFFMENALFWLEQYHIDVLRLDAVHGIYDFGASHFLAELQQAVQELASKSGRTIHLIAESDLNDTKILNGPQKGGFGLDAQWSDDFHHSLHTLLTGETGGYYADFGNVAHLASTLKQGWFYSGGYSKFRGRHHGNSPRGLASSCFVVFNQNHDQVGNRAYGDRLSKQVDFESLKLAAGVTLLSPFVPLLFMGEEYGETAPFLYFTSHGDPDLAEAVRKGRREEFADFQWQGEIPDPQSESTFEASKLNHALQENKSNQILLNFYRELIGLRAEYGLGQDAEVEVAYSESPPVITMVRRLPATQVAMIFYFGSEGRRIEVSLLPGQWRKRLDSSDQMWLGSGSGMPETANIEDLLDVELRGRSFLVLERSGRADE